MRVLIAISNGDFLFNEVSLYVFPLTVVVVVFVSVFVVVVVCAIGIAAAFKNMNCLWFYTVCLYALL